MKLKPGVKLGGVSPEIVLALAVADQVMDEHGNELTVTSLLDGQHSPKSLHYVGKAADLRTRDIPESERDQVRDAIALALGPEFDVVLEADHIHLEHDPKPHTT